MLSKNIVYFRKQKQMTQETLAEKLNVSRQAVSKWESGLTEPDVQTLIKLSDIFEVSLDELVKGEHQDIVKDNEEVENTNIKNDKSKKIKKILLVLLVCVIASLSLFNNDNENKNTNNNSNANSEVNSWLINEQLKEYDFISQLLCQVDIISYNEQKVLFSGSVSAWSFLDGGELTILFDDGSKETLDLVKEENRSGIYVFEKEIPAKKIKNMTIQLDNKEAFIEPIQYRILDYMYKINTRFILLENEGSFELKPSFTWDRDNGYDQYFDPCMNVTNKSEDDSIDIFPISIKIMRNDKLIKEVEIHSFDEFSKNIMIDEKYNPLSSYDIHVEYSTPLGDKIKFTNMIDTYN